MRNAFLAGLMVLVSACLAPDDDEPEAPTATESPAALVALTTGRTWDRFITETGGVNTACDGPSETCVSVDKTQPIHLGQVVPTTSSVFTCDSSGPALSSCTLVTPGSPPPPIAGTIWCHDFLDCVEMWWFWCQPNTYRCVGSGAEERCRCEEK